MWPDVAFARSPEDAIKKGKAYANARQEASQAHKQVKRIARLGRKNLSSSEAPKADLHLT